MSLTPAEKKVRKLARLPSNTECPNCGTVKQFGFSTVCIKYHTFVCSNCKTSHQAISHRCKSLTMSSWTDAEVAELERKGNAYAKRTWLQNAPPVGSGGRPREGDDVNIFKRFIVEAYEKKRYYGEDNGASASAPAAPGGMAVATAVPLSGPPPSNSFSAPRSMARPPVSAPPVAAAPVSRPPAPAPAPVADLLDFSSAPATTPSTAKTTANNTSAGGFVADFDAFGISSTPAPSAPPVVAAPAPTPTPPSTAAVHDPFAPFASAPAPATPSSSGFSFISSPPAAAPAAPPASAKKPVMSSQSSSQKSSLISSMNMTSVSQQQQGQVPMGFGSGVVTGTGMQQPNMMNMMQNQQGFGGAGMTGMNMNMNNMNMNMMQMQMMGMNNAVNNPATMGMHGGMNPMMMNSSGGFGAGGPTNMNMMAMNNANNGFSSSSNNSNNNKPKSSMNSLDMNINSMSAWTSGGK